MQTVSMLRAYEYKVGQKVRLRGVLGSQSRCVVRAISYGVDNLRVELVGVRTGLFSYVTSHEIEPDPEL